MSEQRRLLLASMLITFVFGSIHAFSVFLPVLENDLERSRATLSLIYSLALIALTLSVLFGHRVYALFSPTNLIMAASLGGGVGLIIAAQANTWLQLFLGYSLLFGASNGLAYGYCLQLVGRNIPDKGALPMAMVTAAYALGAIVYSFILGYLVSFYSVSVALAALAGSVVIAGSIGAFFVHKSNTHYQEVTATESQLQAEIQIDTRLTILLWLAYAASVFAGLMMIGHATAIIQSVGGTYQTGVWGAVCVAVGSALGGFYVAWKVSADNMNNWLLGLPLFSAISLALLFLSGAPLLSIFLLSLVGFCYGAVIAVYPYTINQLFGLILGPSVYATVFTAWGFAGLAGPWLAGALFDQLGSYHWAIVLATCIAVCSSVIFWRFKLTLQ